MHCFNIIISTGEIYLKATENTYVLLLDSGLELDNVNFYTCGLKSQNRIDHTLRVDTLSTQ